MAIKGLLGIALAVLLLASTQGAATASRLLLEAPENKASNASYANIWMAAQSEMWFMQQLSGAGYLSGKINVIEWASNEFFSTTYRIARDSKVNATAFLPGPIEAWKEQAAAQCMSLQEFMNTIAANPAVAAQYVRSFFIPGKAVTSAEFKDGDKLLTFAGPIVLGKREANGSTQWLLRNASAVRVPGTNHTYQDVGIIQNKMDIKAGNAIVHIIDLPIRVDSLERFRAEQRAQALLNAGLPADSPTCTNLEPEKPNPGSTIGIAVGAAIGGAAAIGGVCVALWCMCRKRRGCFKNRKGSGGGSAVEAGKDVAAKVSSDAMTDVPSIKDQYSIPSSGQPPSMTGTDTTGGRMGVLVKAGSSTYSSAGTALSYGAGVSNSSVPTAYGSGGASGMPQQFSVIGADNSPFAMFGADNYEMPMAYGMSVAAPLSAGTTNPSSRGGGSRHGDQSSRSDNASGHSSMLASAESGRDGMGPLPALGGNHSPDNGMDYKSYEGGLLPTPSMPIGQIPHALVVPYDELTLDDLIGAGAEGKVYRGTWKHTDIAAKEYLPHLPGESDPQSPLSEAAKANAQAALAKEVYWLTRLNHPNLVRFCAVCLERPMVVMEYYKNGSVFDIIRKAESELGDMSGPAQINAAQLCCQYLSWDRRLMMLHDVAAGMSYLHGRNHIHGDLRSPNLFVGADGKVKIGDFGFTKRLACNKASLRVARITHPRWVAPELLMDNMLSRASDVYSFGIIMFELLTFRIPFEELRKEQVVLEVMRGQRPDIPVEDEMPPGTSTHSCLDTYIRLMEECWSQEAADRPCFEVIARRLKAMQRWRKLKVRLSHVGETARRIHSSPAMQRPSTSGGDVWRQGSAPSGATTDSLGGGDSCSPAARRVVSAPPVGGSAIQQQEQQSVRDQLLQPMEVPAWQPPLLSQLPPSNSLKYSYGISSISEVDVESGGTNSSGQQPRARTGGYVDDMKSLVTSADYHGARLAIIPTKPAMEEQDALASVVDPDSIAEAKRVLLVASDLPSRYAANIHEHGLKVRKSWRRHMRRNNTISS